MNARDIIKLAAQLYVYDALKKKITILTNIQKRKLRGIKKMFVPELEFELHKRQLNRILEIERLKLKILEKEIKINSINARIELTAIAAILKPSEMSDTDFVLKINEKMNELWSEETLIRDGTKINQELLEIQKTLGELEKQREV